MLMSPHSDREERLSESGLDSSSLFLVLLGLPSTPYFAVTTYLLTISHPVVSDWAVSLALSFLRQVPRTLP
jgi:hypothetical protein